MIIETTPSGRSMSLPPRNTGRVTLLFFTTLLVILGLFGYLFWNGYQTGRREAIITANNLAEILARTIEGDFDRAQGDLGVFAQQIGAADLSGHPSAERRSDIEAWMGKHLRSFPAVVNYHIFNAQGQTVFGAGSVTPHVPFNVADRAWFQQLRDDPSRDVVISEVLIGRMSKEQRLIMAIAIRDGEGHFIGAANAAINLVYFQALIDRPDIGEKGLIAVRRTDDSRLALRRPRVVEQLNQPLEGRGLAGLILSGQPHGEGDFISPVDDIARSYAFVTLPAYPLNVIVAVAAEDYLRSWRNQSMASGLAALALIAILMMLYRRQLETQDRLSAYAQASEIGEARLHREAERFRALLRTASDGLHVLDLDGNLAEASDSFLRGLGYADDEAATLKISDWDPEMSPEILRSRYLPILSNQQPRLIERRHHRRDGTVFDTEINAHLVEIDGRTYIYASSRDVTERKRIDGRLQLLAGVFTHANEGIMIIDAHGVIVEVNDGFTRITGYAREDVSGRNPRLFISDQYPEEFHVAIRRAVIKTGFWKGEIWNRRQNNEVYAAMLTASVVQDASGAIQNFIVLFTDITPLKEHQRQLEHMAHFDALTDLPNRSLLADRLQQAMAQTQRRGSSLAVAYLDLDGFKAVNDDYGHAFGDALLTGVSRRLKSALREGDTLARIGGDEFVALLVDLDRPDDWKPVLDRLLRAAADPISVSGTIVVISASIGVAIFPNDGVDADLLLRHADQAMYLAKQAGKNRYHLFAVDSNDASP
ncbi:MAG TPA: diguanylate cyclase [Telmatospirillum sp.]|nr:diguanylate cyclase [Telmatospirillum sp.]